MEQRQIYATIGQKKVIPLPQQYYLPTVPWDGWTLMVPPPPIHDEILTDSHLCSQELAVELISHWNANSRWRPTILISCASWLWLQTGENRGRKVFHLVNRLAHLKLTLIVTSKVPPPANTKAVAKWLAAKIKLSCWVSFSCFFFFYKNPGNQNISLHLSDILSIHFVERGWIKMLA